MPSRSRLRRDSARQRARQPGRASSRAASSALALGRSGRSMAVHVVEWAVCLRASGAAFVGAARAYCTTFDSTMARGCGGLAGGAADVHRVREKRRSRRSIPRITSPRARAALQLRRVR
jgi:hypothetical protein